SPTQPHSPGKSHRLPPFGNRTTPPYSHPLTTTQTSTTRPNMILCNCRLHHNKHACRTALPEIRGLRAHDERLVEQLASRALSRRECRRKVHVKRDEEGRIIEAGGTGEGQDDGGDAAAESALLHFSSPRDAATIAAFLRTRVYRPESLV